MIRKKLEDCSSLLPVLYLYIIQSSVRIAVFSFGNPGKWKVIVHFQINIHTVTKFFCLQYSDDLLKLLAGLTSADQNLNWYKSLIMAAVVNKSTHYTETLNYIEKMRESFGFLDSFKCKARLCAALLLFDRREGPAYFTAVITLV